MLATLKDSDFDELFKVTLGMFSINPSTLDNVTDKMIRDAFRQALIARNSCWQDFEKAKEKYSGSGLVTMNFD